MLTAAWSRVQPGMEEPHPWPWPVPRLRAPRLAEDLLVLAGGSGRTLAFGPGHVDGTAAPGTGGVTVITGHRDTHFRFLRDLVSGNRLHLTDRTGAEIAYVVRTRHVVHKDKARLVMNRQGLAIVTCYPFDAVTAGRHLRYVVLAEPEESLSTMPMNTATAPPR